MNVRFIIDELMGCFPQMEELVGTRNPHASNDFLLLFHRLPGPNSAHGDRKYNLFYLKRLVFLFYFVLCEEDVVENELCCRFYAARFCCSPLGNLKASSCAGINIFFPLKLQPLSDISFFVFSRVFSVSLDKQEYFCTCSLVFLFAQVLCVQIKCFHEIITIGYSVYHSYDLPWFRTLSW